jgi:hypothetical protein
MCRALRAGFVFRRSSVSVSILTRTALQNVWSLRAGALGASQFGFHAPDRVLRPEPRDEFLDAAPKCAHEDALFLR